MIETKLLLAMSRSTFSNTVRTPDELETVNCFDSDLMEILNVVASFIVAPRTIW